MNTKRAKPFLVIIFSLTAGTLVGIALIVVYMRPKMERIYAENSLVRTGGRKMVESWLVDVRSGNLAKAHEATTPAFRGQFDLAKFEELVAKHPDLKNSPDTWNWAMQGGSSGVSFGLDGINIRSTPNVFTLKSVLRPKDGSVPKDLEIVVLKDTDSDRLEVDQIRFEPAPKP